MNCFFRILNWCVEKRNIVCAADEVLERFFARRGPVNLDNLAFKGCDSWMDFTQIVPGSSSEKCLRIIVVKSFKQIVDTPRKFNIAPEK